MVNGRCWCLSKTVSWKGVKIGKQGPKRIKKKKSFKHDTVAMNIQDDYEIKCLAGRGVLGR